MSVPPLTNIHTAFGGEAQRPSQACNCNATAGRGTGMHEPCTHRGGSRGLAATKAAASSSLSDSCSHREASAHEHGPSTAGMPKTQAAGMQSRHAGKANNYPQATSHQGRQHPSRQAGRRAVSSPLRGRPPTHRASWHWPTPAHHQAGPQGAAPPPPQPHEPELRPSAGGSAGQGRAAGQAWQQARCEKDSS